MIDSTTTKPIAPRCAPRNQALKAKRTSSAMPIQIAASPPTTKRTKSAWTTRTTSASCADVTRRWRVRWLSTGSPPAWGRQSRSDGPSPLQPSREERMLAEAIADQDRRRGLLLPFQEDRARRLDVVSGSEADEPAAVLLLRDAVHPRAGGAVERHLVAVAGEEVLAEILALLLEEVAQPPEHRIVAQH